MWPSPFGALRKRETKNGRVPPFPYVSLSLCIDVAQAVPLRAWAPLRFMPDPAILSKRAVSPFPLPFPFPLPPPFANAADVLSNFAFLRLLAVCLSIQHRSLILPCDCRLAITLFANSPDWRKNECGPLSFAKSVCRTCSGSSFPVHKPTFLANPNSRL